MEPLTDGTDHLRVLIANERKDRLAQVASIVAALGHHRDALEPLAALESKLKGSKSEQLERSLVNPLKPQPIGHERDKAKQIWTKALQIDPNNEMLKKFLYSNKGSSRVEIH